MHCGDYSGSSHTSDLKIGTPDATLPSAWRYRVSVGTGWPSVSILQLGEVKEKTLICNFYLSVAARTMSEQTRPSDTLACCWDVKQPTTKNNSKERGGLGEDEEQRKEGWRRMGRGGGGEGEAEGDINRDGRTAS